MGCSLHKKIGANSVHLPPDREHLARVLLLASSSASPRQVGLYEAAIDCYELAHALDASEHLSELVLGWRGECVARDHLEQRVASVFVLLYQQLRQYLDFCTRQPGRPNG